MSRKPSRKPKPKRGSKVFTATKEEAAIGQLESAINLWFNDGDPISILVLASNAEDCFHSLSKRIGKPSFFKGRVEMMPWSFQERAQYIQDFAKHGEKDIDEKVEWGAQMAEVLMMAAIICYEHLRGKSTPLMALFSIRLYYENPTFVLPEFQAPFLEGAAIYNVGSGNRKEFFDFCQPLLI